MRTEDGERIAIESADERGKSRLERAGLLSRGHDSDLIGIGGWHGRAGWMGRSVLPFPPRYFSIVAFLM